MLGATTCYVSNYAPIRTPCSHKKSRAMNPAFRCVTTCHLDDSAPFEPAGALFSARLVRRLTRPLNDEIARSCGSGNSFVQSQFHSSLDNIL